MKNLNTCTFTTLTLLIGLTSSAGQVRIDGDPVLAGQDKATLMLCQRDEKYIIKRFSCRGSTSVPLNEWTDVEDGVQTVLFNATTQNPIVISEMAKRIQLYVLTVPAPVGAKTVNVFVDLTQNNEQEKFGLRLWGNSSNIDWYRNLCSANDSAAERACQDLETPNGVFKTPVIVDAKGEFSVLGIYRFHGRTWTEYTNYGYLWVGKELKPDSKILVFPGAYGYRYEDAQGNIVIKLGDQGIKVK